MEDHRQAGVSFKKTYWRSNASKDHIPRYAKKHIMKEMFSSIGNLKEVFSDRNINIWWHRQILNPITKMDCKLIFNATAMYVLS